MQGHFYNPNIHPFLEYERRVGALRTVAGAEDLPMSWDASGYGLRPWMKALGGETAPGPRCLTCYRIRLEKTAALAAHMGLAAFSTTLLYSRYQRHDDIRRVGEEVAAASGVRFYYEDFRVGWEAGLEEARRMDIYRQPYCGCIFSEEERYMKRAKRLEAQCSVRQESGL